MMKDENLPWTEITTLHGALYFGRATNPFSKTLWFLLILAAFTVTCWQVSELTIEYINGPHFYAREKLRITSSNTFPNVTICNFNRINRTKADELGLNTDAQAHFLKMFNQYSIVNADDVENDTIKHHQYEWQAFQQRQPSFKGDIKSLVAMLAHSCDETLFRCMWKGVRFDCCSHAKPIFNKNGMCWVLTPPELDQETGYPQQAFPGVSNGLTIVIHPQLSSYNPDLVLNNNLQEGFQVHGTFNPEEYYSSEQVSVSPGTHAYIVLQKIIEFTKVPEYPIFRTPCEKQILRYSKGKYSYANCQSECLFDWSLKNCGCAFLSELQGNYKFCGPDETIACFNGQITENVQSHFPDCYRKCKPPCDPYWRVKSSTSYTRISAPKMKALQQIFNAEDVDELLETSIVELYYEEMVNSMIELTEKTAVFQFISGIGGQFGFWLGASIITLIQTVTHFIWYCYKASVPKSSPNLSPPMIYTYSTANRPTAPPYDRTTHNENAMRVAMQKPQLSYLASY